MLAVATDCVHHVFDQDAITCFHPVVFQLYVLGHDRRLRARPPRAGSRWRTRRTASAAAWIPSGVTTIIAVPLIGVGNAVLTTSAVGSALSFLVFWLGFGEPMKTHDIGGAEIARAGVHARQHRRDGRPRRRAPRLAARRGAAEAAARGVGAERLRRAVGRPQRRRGGDEAADVGAGGRAQDRLLGYVAASVSGVFSSLQTYGNRARRRRRRPPTSASTPSARGSPPSASPPSRAPSSRTPASPPTAARAARRARRRSSCG